MHSQECRPLCCQVCKRSTVHNVVTPSNPWRQGWALWPWPARGGHATGAHCETMSRHDAPTNQHASAQLRPPYLFSSPLDILFPPPSPNWEVHKGPKGVWEPLLVDTLAFPSPTPPREGAVWGRGAAGCTKAAQFERAQSASSRDHVFPVKEDLVSV